MNKEKLKKLLPSKKISIRILIALVALLLVITIFFLLTNKEFFNSGKKPDLRNETILNLMQMDTDEDSIPDWEESLWGTDKNRASTFEGMTDVEYVNAKKRELNTEQLSGDTRLNETEKFAREFFSAYTAMETGQVDDLTISSFANALGQKVVNPALTDQYEAKDVKINTEDTPGSRKSYYETVKNLFEGARGAGAGSEVEIVSQGMLEYNATGESKDLEELLVIAEGYKEFAKEVMDVQVPESIQDIHLAMANGANNTGISVANMAKVITDPIVGLSGLSQYQKYSDDLINAVSDLETIVLSQ